MFWHIFIIFISSRQRSSSAINLAVFLQRGDYYPRICISVSVVHELCSCEDLGRGRWLTIAAISAEVVSNNQRQFGDNEKTVSGRVHQCSDSHIFCSGLDYILLNRWMLPRLIGTVLFLLFYKFITHSTDRKYILGLSSFIVAFLLDLLEFIFQDV